MTEIPLPPPSTNTSYGTDNAVANQNFIDGVYATGQKVEFATNGIKDKGIETETLHNPSVLGGSILSLVGEFKEVPAEAESTTDTIAYVGTTEYYTEPYSIDGFMEGVRQKAENGAPEEVIEILTTGGLDGKHVDYDPFVRNGRSVLSIRETLADIYGRNPNNAKFLIENEIVGIHGTRSAALADILEQGALLSAKLAKERGIAHVTGEHVFQGAKGQSTISFTTLEHTKEALVYTGSLDSFKYTKEEMRSKLQRDIEKTRKLLARQTEGSRISGVINNTITGIEKTLLTLDENPDSLRSELLCDDFPMLFGISREVALKKVEGKEDWRVKKRTSSDLNEFRPASDEIDLEDLFIAVPESRMQKVKELLVKYGKPNVVVLNFDDFVEEDYRIKARSFHEEQVSPLQGYVDWLNPPKNDDL